MKRLIVIAACSSMIPNISFGQTVNMDVSVTVRNPTTYGVALDEVKDIRTYGSDAWWTKQCCMQAESGRETTMCSNPKYQERINDNKCPAFGIDYVVGVK